jgi:predicted MFS family arabinose efflux permease
MTRLKATAAVFGTAFRNRSLLRLELAFSAFCGAEWGVWVSLVVYAYTRGGATAAGAIAVVQLVPSVLLAPFIGALTDRRRAGRVLSAGYLLQAVTTGAVALAIALDAPTAAVFALAPLAYLTVAVPRPAQAALLPWVVRSPLELTAANVVSGWVGSGSALVAPAATGALIALGGPALSIGVFAVLCLGAALAMLPLPGPRPATDAQDRKPLVTQVSDGIRAVSQAPAVRLLVVLLAAQYVLVGALDILSAVLAIDVLGLGQSGTGYLNAAFGAGAVVGASATVLLVARRRIAPALALGIVVAALALAVLGVWPTVVGAFLLFAVVGSGRTLFDVTGRILLQRAAPPRTLAEVFALLESLMNVGLCVGVVFVPLLVAVSGARLALLGTAALFLALVAATWTKLRALDASADVPQVEIQLLASIPIFAPLPAPALEGLARALVAVKAEAGEVIVREGEPGDRYFAIADGEVVVSRAGREVARLKRGDGFGEIALLEKVPRTATVVAATQTQLYALEMGPFVFAVTGHPAAERAAGELVTQRLEELESL